MSDILKEIGDVAAAVEPVVDVVAPEFAPVVEGVKDVAEVADTAIQTAAPADTTGDAASGDAATAAQPSVGEGQVIRVESFLDGTSPEEALFAMMNLGGDQGMIGSDTVSTDSIQGTFEIPSGIGAQLFPDAAPVEGAEGYVSVAASDLYAKAAEYQAQGKFEDFLPQAPAVPEAAESASPAAETQAETDAPPSRVNSIVSFVRENPLVGMAGVAAIVGVAFPSVVQRFTKSIGEGVAFYKQIQALGDLVGNIGQADPDAPAVQAAGQALDQQQQGRAA